MLPARRASTEVYLYSVPEGLTTARVPVLQAGDYLVFEEVAARAPAPRRRRSGAPPARPHRGGRRRSTDPLYARTLVADVLQIRRSGQRPLPLLRVRWRRADALRFPLCLSARLDDDTLVRNVSVARGNIVLADHG